MSEHTPTPTPTPTPAPAPTVTERQRLIWLKCLALILDEHYQINS
jgi:hypothetical protein